MGKTQHGDGDRGDGTVDGDNQDFSRRFLRLKTELVTSAVDRPMRIPEPRHVISREYKRPQDFHRPNQSSLGAWPCYIGRKIPEILRLKSVSESRVGETDGEDRKVELVKPTERTLKSRGESPELERPAVY